MQNVSNRWDKPVPELDVTDPDHMLGLGLTPGNSCSFFPHHSSDYVDLVVANQPTLGHQCVCLAERASVSPTTAASSQEDGDLAANLPSDLDSADAAPYWASPAVSACVDGAL